MMCSNIQNLIVKFIMKIKNGWLTEVKHIMSPHFDTRAHNQVIRLLVIHNISLPAGCFGDNYISQLFTGQLDCRAHPSFKSLFQLKVSAHCLIRRDGEIIQYVSFNDRAWHAGVSQYKDDTSCNDFSIGIELEGTDLIPYTKTQYQQLSKLSYVITKQYVEIKDNIVGHCDIAPERKTDPGIIFDWSLYKTMLNQQRNN